MSRQTKYAAMLGRIKSPKKATAARRNGRLGGRPRKSPNRQSASNTNRRLTIRAGIDCVGGYFQHLQELFKGFSTAGYHVNIRPNSVATPYGQKVPTELQARFVHSAQPEDLEILLSHPTSTVPTPGKKTVWITMFEATNLPPIAVRELNKAAVVVVPNEWNESCFAAAGVTAPIRVVPLGIDPVLYKYRPWPKSDKLICGCAAKLANGPRRKSMPDTVAHFLKAFEGVENVELRLKIHPDDLLADYKDPRISVIREFWPDSKMAEWYAGIHLFITAARSGGWELMPHQAMAVGRPCLSIKHGGIAEFFNESVGFKVQHVMEPAGDIWRGLGMWGAPVEGHFVSQLQRAYEALEQLELLGQRASLRAHEFTWERSVKELIDVLDEFEGEAPTLVEVRPVTLKGPTLREKADARNKSSRKPGEKVFLQLGRYGDLINLLPAFKWCADQGGKPTKVIVSKDFANLFDGVSYVEPIIFDGDCNDVRAAEIWASGKFRGVTTQVCGTNHLQMGKSGHYNVESWNLTGIQSDSNQIPFGSLPLVFDRRDYARERLFVNTYVFPHDGAPLILVNDKAHSAPFKYADELWKNLQAEFKDVRLLRLDDVKAERIYDILGLMDVADVMVTVDTATLHLAAASQIKVVALLNDQKWLGTKIHPDVKAVGRMWYSEYWTPPSDKKLLDMVRWALPQYPGCYTSKIIHAAEYHSGQDARRAAAWKSWEALYGRNSITRAHLQTYPRHANQTLGDRRILPYLKDVLENGMKAASSPDDIILFTNDDNILHPDLPAELRRQIARHGVISGARIDVSQFPDLALPPGELARLGQKHSGRDLFAFRKQWLVDNWDEIPDYILGASEYDLHLLVMLRQRCGVASVKQDQFLEPVAGVDLPLGYVLHERHAPAWMASSNVDSAPSQKHNRALFKNFMEVNAPDFKIAWA